MKDKSGIEKTLEQILWANEMVQQGQKENNSIDVKQFSWFKHQQLNHLLKDLEYYDLSLSLPEFTLNEIEQLAAKYVPEPVSPSLILSELENLEDQKENKSQNEYLKNFLLEKLKQLIEQQFELPVKLEKVI